MSEDLTRRHPDHFPTSPPALRPEVDEHLMVGVFENFRSGVIDLDEHGEELVVIRDVWISEELVITTRVIERTALVREVIRRVDVDVEPMRGPSDPL